MYICILVKDMENNNRFFEIIIYTSKSHLLLDIITGIFWNIC